MKIRFMHAKILTMEEGEKGLVLIEDGELHVLGDRITYVGTGMPEEDECAYTFDREIDCEGNLLMPGFKNAHAHGPMTFLRSMADDMPLDEWLNKQVFPAEAKLLEEDTYWLHQLAVLEYLTSGITASFEMYFIDGGIRRAAKETGFRTVLCGAACGNDLGWIRRMEQDLEQPAEGNLTEEKTKDGLVTFRLGFHAEYSTDRRLLEGVADLAGRYQVPVYTHCQETKKETLECIDRYGLTPVQFLTELGMFDYGGGLFHGVHPMEGDMECMKSHGISVITNPGSNAKLASGIAPLTAYDKEEILLGLGTDGPASNNCLDMFWEMHLASVLQKLKNEDAKALTAEKVLRMATVNGAEIMGLSDCDVLAVGKKADLIMIDLNMPNMQPIHNVAKNLVYSGSKQNVCMTMINGQILYEGGVFAPHIDVERIYARAREIVKRIR